MPLAAALREGAVDATKPALLPRYHVQPVPKVSAAPPVASCFRTTVNCAPLTKPVTLSARVEVAWLSVSVELVTPAPPVARVTVEPSVNEENDCGDGA